MFWTGKEDFLLQESNLNCKKKKKKKKEKKKDFLLLGKQMSKDNHHSGQDAYLEGFYQQ